jgi:hypothetical protein
MRLHPISDAFAISLATLVGAMLVLMSTAHAQQVTAPDVPCTCRYKGQDYSIGDSICLGSGSSTRMATCSMVLNNTSWHMSQSPCPQAFLIPPPEKPVQQASPDELMSSPVF